MFQVLSHMHCVNYWYLNFNGCSSEQHPLKTVGKTEIWNWNNLVILRGEFTFDLMERSCTVIATHLSSWIWIRLTFLWWKYGFKMVKITFVHRVIMVMCGVHVDHRTGHMLGRGQRTATQTGVESTSDIEHCVLAPLASLVKDNFEIWKTNQTKSILVNLLNLSICFIQIVYHSQKLCRSQAFTRDVSLLCFTEINFFFFLLKRLKSTNFPWAMKGLSKQKKQF